MQLNQLRAFLVAAEEGSFSRAASRLRIGQPSLTRQIAALEHESGAQLFERTSRGVLLTAAGKRFADSIEKPLANIEHALQQTRRFAGGERTELRIGYLPALARSYLNPALAALRTAHPRLRVKLTDMCAAGSVQALRADEIDIALVGDEVPSIAREFYTRRIETLRVVAAMPADHPLASRLALRLADLRSTLFVGKNEGNAPGFNDWVVQMCRRAGYRPRFVQNAETIPQMLSLAVSEGAVTLIPEIAVEGSPPSLVTRVLGDAAARWECLAVWQRGRTAPAVRAFLDAIPTPPIQRREALKSA